MKTPTSIVTAINLGKTQRIFVLTFLSLALISGLVMWYYVSSSQATMNSSIENVPDTTPAPLSDVLPKSETHESVVEIQSTLPSNDSSEPTTTVKIDGQHVTVPENNQEHRVIQSPNGTTTIDVSVDSNSTTGKSSNSSTTAIESNSSTEISSSSKSSTTVP